jgi:glycosyltransferase involved in cell wall biosynthesis
MPVFNAEAWLVPALDCLQKQTFGDFELIVSDNASSDNSLGIVEEYARRDKRIRVLRQTRNIGANGNYRAVLAAASADLFKWAAANDLCAPRFLERCVDAMQKRPDVVLAYPRTLLFEHESSDGVLYDHDFALDSDDRSKRFADLLATMLLNNAMNGVIRRRALERILPLGTFRSADILMMCELALLGKYALVDEPLFYRRMSAAAATSLRSAIEADKHLVPTAKRPLRWQNWKYQLRMVRIVMRAWPYDREWYRVAYHALQRVSWARGLLALDVQTALKNPFH